MFGGRKHRQAAPPLTKETANPNAATAAAAVFGQRRPQSPSLPAAAAAAALKARPTSPINVADVQTKRTHRRSPSLNSSITSRDRTPRRELQRSPSVSSMTERTFRSPSPGRSPAPRQQQVPPVPQIPRGTAQGGHRKALSVQTQPFRTASQKRATDKGSWFGGAAAGDPDNVRTSDYVLQSGYSPSSERPSSPSSINFSYPRGRLESPTGRPRPMSSSAALTDQSLVYDANSRRMRPRNELVNVQRTVQAASEKPVQKKKKRSKTDLLRSLSPLGSRSMGRTRVHEPEANSGALASSEIQSTKAPVADGTVKPQHAAMSREETLVEPTQQQPDEIAPAANPIEATGDATPVIPSESPADRIPEAVREQPEQEEFESREPQKTLEPATVEGASAASSTAATAVAAGAPELDNKQLPLAVPEADDANHARVPSVSPARSPGRSAHFAPSTAEQLHVRHEPPPRSLSPRKSALKSSLRDVSPSAESSDSSPANTNTPSKDDTPSSKRKSARVSFNDESTVVVGEAAPHVDDSSSHILPSPQNKKAWTGVLGRLGKKDQPAVIEDEETMGSRPALPLFGSVRQKKTAEPEERPLVRPLDRTESPQPSAAVNGNLAKTDMGHSSDAAVGSAIAAEAALNKYEANISKSREPLPPVVTSLDTPENFDNTDPESEDEATAEETRPGEDAVLPVHDASVEHTDLPSVVSTGPEDTPKENLSASTVPVPTIALQEASPLAQPRTEAEQPDTAGSKEYFGVPGGFPAEQEDDETTPTQENVSFVFPTSHEPDSSTSSTQPLAEGIATSNAMDDITEESEADSIYSDAYEDLSETEGDGFLSLDAVLESPASAQLPKRVLEKAKAEALEARATEQTAASTATQGDGAPDDWASAKAYWKSLSTARRRQLEEEAAEEAGHEADVDSTQKPIKQNRKAGNGTVPSETKLNGQGADMSPSEASSARHRGYQIQPGTKWEELGYAPQQPAKRNAAPEKPRPKSMGFARKSMRDADPAPRDHTTASSTMRKSLRPESDDESVASAGGFRRSMRANGNNASKVSKQARPMSYADPASASKTKALQASGLRRRGSDSSESSFTRARPNGGEGFGFRKSMRGSMREPTKTLEPQSSPEGTAKASSRFSLRSLSPTPFRRNSASMTPSPQVTSGGHMRMSMRENAKATKGKQGGKAGKKTQSKRNSRFADSSDEDEPRGGGFRSRFVDSSDEDEPSRPMSKGSTTGSKRFSKASGSAAAAAMGVPPVPRLESPERFLTGNDAAPAYAASAPGGTARPTGTLTRNRSSGKGEVASAAPGTLSTSGLGTVRPQHKRSGSFMSNILRRKKDTTPMIARQVSESAARRDTPLERDTEQLAIMRSDSLQRLQKEREGSWPLPDGQAAAAGTSPAGIAVERQRPSTSGGPISSPKSTLKRGQLKRRSVSHQGVIGAQQEDASSAVAGHLDADGNYTAVEGAKKKKFSGLRKMLGIKD